MRSPEDRDRPRQSAARDLEACEVESRSENAAAVVPAIPFDPVPAGRSIERDRAHAAAGDILEREGNACGPGQGEAESYGAARRIRRGTVERERRGGRRTR